MARKRSDNPLELVGTIDLIKELQRRHDHAAVVLSSRVDGTREHTRFRWHGDPHKLIGMLEESKAVVLSAIFHNYQKPTNDNADDDDDP
jgi:hypothetical protein